MQLNAGQRLWLAQKKQGTGLCVGLDPHFDPTGPFNEGLYALYVHPELFNYFRQIHEALWENSMFYCGRFADPKLTCMFLSAVTNYLLKVVDAAWNNGIRIFKPQSAFYEQFGPFAFVVMGIVRHHIQKLAEKTNEPSFVIDDAKRGDIDTTQKAYLRAILASPEEDLIPGMGGQLYYDAMTVTTWMGQDVLTPALPYLNAGKGVIVVTRTSNPSGTTLQDALVEPNLAVPLSDAQQKFQLTHNDMAVIVEIIGRVPTAAEAMLYLTEKFCADNGLVQDGVSPVFSVIGATVKMDDAFRKLRPTGIALIPAFGFQGGGFDNIITLAATEGPLAGHLGILNSARGVMFAWLKKVGGNGDPSPEKLEGEIARAIDQFRHDEKVAYETAGLTWPF